MQNQYQTHDYETSNLIGWNQIFNNRLDINKSNLRC